MFILALISVWSNLACIIANIQLITHCAALFFIRSPLLELQCLPQQQAFTQLPATIAGLQSSVFSLQCHATCLHCTTRRSPLPLRKGLQYYVPLLHAPLPCLCGKDSLTHHAHRFHNLLPDLSFLATLSHKQGFTQHFLLHPLAFSRVDQNHPLLPCQRQRDRGIPHV